MAVDTAMRKDFRDSTHWVGLYFYACAIWSLTASRKVSQSLCWCSGDDLHGAASLVYPL